MSAQESENMFLKVTELLAHALKPHSFDLKSIKKKRKRRRWVPTLESGQTNPNACCSEFVEVLLSTLCFFQRCSAKRTALLRLHRGEGTAALLECSSISSQRSLIQAELYCWENLDKKQQPDLSNPSWIEREIERGKKTKQKTRWTIPPITAGCVH